MSKAPVRHYCTYFDINYLARGMVLHQSLARYSESDFCFYVLCLDEQVEEALEKLDVPSIVPISLTDVEAWDGELLKAKKNRSRIEYYFTLSPILPLYVLDHFDCGLITYLDADLMFFSSPEAIFDELGEKSVFVTEHRFSPHLRESVKYGRFNVQCQTFRKDNTGVACLRHWRKQCLEWCYDRLEDDKFADQKYLDAWPELYGDSLVISRHPGIGVAPWNVESDIGLSIMNKCPSTSNGPLIFYHFHGFKNLSYRFFAKTLYPYHVTATREVDFLYRQYAYALRAAETFLKKECVDMAGNHSTAPIRRFDSKNWRVFLASLRRGDILFVS